MRHGRNPALQNNEKYMGLKEIKTDADGTYQKAKGDELRNSR